MNRSFAARLRSRERLLGTVVTLPSPEVAEILRDAGFDWLFIDMQHAPLGALEVQRLAMAARLPCLVGLADAGAAAIGRVLDCGVTGVVAPDVRSASQAGEIVARCKYPPLGARGVGLARAQGYGMGFAEYIGDANDETVVVLQIEHIDAVHEIEAIVAAPGVNALFASPYDLSASIGKPGHLSDGEVLTAIGRVRQVCEEAQLPLGVFCSDLVTARRYAAQGCTPLAVGLDTVLLGGAARDVVQSLL